MILEILTLFTVKQMMKQDILEHRPTFWLWWFTQSMCSHFSLLCSFIICTWAHPYIICEVLSLQYRWKSSFPTISNGSWKQTRTDKVRLKEKKSAFWTQKHESGENGRIIITSWQRNGGNKEQPTGKSAVGGSVCFYLFGQPGFHPDPALITAP